MEFPLSESLNLMFKPITDEGIDELTNELVNNTRLRGHNFWRNHYITAVGCVALSIVLRDPNSALGKLVLSRNCISTISWFLMQTRCPTTASWRTETGLWHRQQQHHHRRLCSFYPRFVQHLQASRTRITPTIRLVNSLMNPTNTCCLKISYLYCNSI